MLYGQHSQHHHQEDQALVLQHATKGHQVAIDHHHGGRPPTSHRAKPTARQQVGRQDAGPTGKGKGQVSGKLGQPAGQHIERYRWQNFARPLFVDKERPFPPLDHIDSPQRHDGFVAM